MNLTKILFSIGIVLVVTSGIFYLMEHFGNPLKLGQLPGDIHIKKNSFSFYFPWVTCLLLSLLISFILRFFR